MKKVIGTSVPLSALWSKKRKENSGNLDTALDFLDWLYLTKQNAWQMLPLHQNQLEEGSSKIHVPSPYKGYGVGLDPKYLSPRLKKLKPSKKELEIFLKKQKEWLPDYVLFCALRDHFKTDDWVSWPQDVRTREKAALNKWQKKLKTKIADQTLKQWQLDYGFEQLRIKAKKLKIELIGDLSFYMPLCSPLVWRFKNLFDLCPDGSMVKVSGSPNGPKAHFGRQVWGHPLYRFGRPSLEKKIEKLWKLRLKYNAIFFDFIRLDHARGFFAYGAIDIKDEKKDNFRKGPGARLLQELIDYSHKNSMNIFAEDFGRKLFDLRKTLRHNKVPGIRILRFGYNEKLKKISNRFSDIEKYPKNAFAITTNHDTETLVGYLDILSVKEKKLVCKNAKIEYSKNNKITAESLRKAVVNSPAQHVIIPIQDWLLTKERINIPGTEKKKNDPNWRYRLSRPIENLPKNLKI